MQINPFGILPNRCQSYYWCFWSASVIKKFNALGQLAARGYNEAGIKTAVAIGSFLPMLASAQATDPFETAMTTATTKVTSYAGALVGLAAVAVVFMIAIKYVKRIPKAS